MSAMHWCANAVALECEEKDSSGVSDCMIEVFTALVMKATVSQDMSPH